SGAAGPAMYAGRRRRKPVPRGGGGGSNPSKRHRERLNRELERLAGLLPFPPDVVAGLDKLSVLRLSAGFLRARSFFGGKGHNQRFHLLVTSAWNCALSPSSFALNGFVLVVTSEGLIFYSSHTIQDYLGFHQVGGILTCYGGSVFPWWCRAASRSLQGSQGFRELFGAFPWSWEFGPHIPRRGHW
uniref:BHLH domain-containing protein n=1 Tax=Cyanoderma ruficeps TaxID=181631 RepID=A0A8C3R1R6_9PASS